MIESMSWFVGQVGCVAFELVWCPAELCWACARSGRYNRGMGHEFFMLQWRGWQLADTAQRCDCGIPVKVPVPGAVCTLF